ncbi:MAG: hypothetical protein HC852_19325 [Acaryochloridaceae cyanobacterium RU_4_10]|nr:hypothetical protein [Acaryochloridaceae cyanobacterium RU_4_10]
MVCDNINQTEQMRFWVSELTTFTPKQVDSVLEVLKTKKMQKVEPIAS